MQIGFCCLWEAGDGLPLFHNQRTTTARYLSTQPPSAQVEKLNELVAHNVAALRAIVDHLSTLPPELRMFRIGSDVLPLYTHAATRALYANGDVDIRAEELAMIGETARKNGVRLSFHPGQYTILQSKTPGVVESGIREFEYHARVAELLGYRGWHDSGFSINIHMGGGADDCSGFRSVLRDLSETARNLITIENDEFTWDTHRLVDEIGHLVPIVLDVHHHTLHTGEYIQPDSLLVECVKATWRGVRPKMHVALSQIEEVGDDVEHNTEIPYSGLIESGKKKSALRKHSYDAWHPASIDYWLQFAPDFDLMFEGKSKNVGQVQIYNRWKR